MKVLLYGAQGWIGAQFSSILKQNSIKFVAGSSRLDNFAQTQSEVEHINPTHIVALTGRTHGKIGEKTYSTIDYLEQDGKLFDNIRDNLFSPVNLALLSSASNIHLTYFGTGCIFKFDDTHLFGNESNGFHEQNLPNFFGSSYSIVKGFTDRLMTRFADSVLNLRIRMPIDNVSNPRNFITKITTYQKICSIPNSMSVLPELLPLALDMMQKKVSGTINFTNPGLISHNEILKMYKNFVDSSFTWENFSEQEQRKILAADRSNNYLDTSKLQTIYPNIKPIKEAVRICLENYRK